MKIPLLLSGVAGLMAGCATERAGDLGMMTAVAVAVPITPAYQGYRIFTGTNFKRGLMIPEVYRLREDVYVLTNDGGWFTADEARYGGKGRHLCLSAWIVDLKSELKDKNGKILLTRQNLDQFFWQSHSSSELTDIPRATKDRNIGEYFQADGKSPFVAIWVGGQKHELMLDQK